MKILHVLAGCSSQLTVTILWLSYNFPCILEALYRFSCWMSLTRWPLGIFGPGKGSGRFWRVPVHHPNKTFLSRINCPSLANNSKWKPLFDFEVWRNEFNGPGKFLHEMRVSRPGILIVRDSGHQRFPLKRGVTVWTC